MRFLRQCLLSLTILFGVSFHLQANQERIISAGSSVTEIMLALGVENSLIAVDVSSDLPENLKLPRVGYHRQLATEGLLSLSPDRLIGSDEMGPDLTINQLKQAGVMVDVVNTQSTIEGLLTRIDQVAEITHSQDKALKLKQEVQQIAKQLQGNHPSLKSTENRAKKLVFLLLRDGRSVSIAGENTPPDAIISLAGGINPASDVVSSYKPISLESLVQMSPDVILVSQRSLKKFEGIDGLLSRLPILEQTPAGKNKQIIAINGHALIGGLGLSSLAEAKRLNLLLHP